MTHSELNNIGAKWLKKHDQNIIIPNCNITVVEQRSVSNEIPDILGFNSSFSVLIETKVSRSNFFKDLKKKHRSGLGIGELRYYLTLPGLIKPDEIPFGWGLLYYNEGIEIIKKAERLPINYLDERRILISVINKMK